MLLLAPVPLLYLSFPPHGWGIIMFVALVPAWVAVEKAATWRQAFVRCWIPVFVGGCVIMPWLADAMHDFGGLPWWLSYACVPILAAVEQLPWPVYSALRHVLHHRLGVRPVLWSPAALMVIDALFPKLFPDTLGLVLYPLPWLRQAADVFGIWGLTALLVATNETIAVALAGTWPKAAFRRNAVATGVFLFAAVAYGAWRHHDIRAAMGSPAGRLRVALVQPNINSMMKVKAETDKEAARARVLELLLRLTDRAVALRPDLVVWPETAFPNFYHSDTPYETLEVTASLDAYLASRKTPLLFGAKDETASHRYNALYLVSSGEIARYHKVILLALGEYVPLVGMSPALARWFTLHNASAYTPGDGPVLFALPQAKLGPMICLEGLYPFHSRRIVRLGADVLLNATNDSWYGRLNEQELHLALTAFRAVETRRPLIRSTNTGISAVIDIDGSFRLRTVRDEEAVVADDVPVYPPLASPFLLWGDKLLLLVALWATWPFVLPLYRKARKK